MKKLAVISILAISLFSCDDKPRGPKAPSQSRLVLDTNSVYFDQNYKVYTLDSCEYIKVGFGRDAWGSHKGDCKNPIHQK